MYAPITPYWNSKIERWHRVNRYAPTRAACNSHFLLEHEKARADLPEGALYCFHCARREPYATEADVAAAPPQF